MQDRDVRLSDEEQRIIAEIERHERLQRSSWRRWRTVVAAFRPHARAAGGGPDLGQRSSWGRSCSRVGY